mmetsp:Transcript_16681/g.15044  ORF Transcript_16681/g.15044 Transcript_16681/m.15044 type:complete len:367 (-) Transcript_16681:50-1150(-)
MDHVVIPRRRNGLVRPWHYLQILTWILFPLLLLHYYAFLMPLLWRRSAYIIITIIFTIVSFIAAFEGYVTCSIDPSDEALHKPKIPRSMIDSDGNYCYICETKVEIISKHCTHCKKCVLRFDHHCKWLNTCIGSKNYKHFLAVVVSVACLVTISSVLSIAYIIESFGGYDRMKDRVHHTYGPSGQSSSKSGSAFHLNLLGVKVISVISVAILFPLLTLVYQLCFFHMMLLSRGLTTYDFIVYENKKLRERTLRGSTEAATNQSVRSPKRTVQSISISNDTNTQNPKVSDVKMLNAIPITVSESGEERVSEDVKVGIDIEMTRPREIVEIDSDDDYGEQIPDSYENTQTGFIAISVNDIDSNDDQKV